MTPCILGQSPIRRRLAWYWISLTSIATFASSARSSDATQGLEQAVSIQINGMVTRDIEAYFRRLNLTQPPRVEATTHAQIDESGPAPQVTGVTLAVKVITDQPPQIIREARHSLMRLLREQGYRMEPVAGNVPDPRPYATLTIEAVPPPPTQDDADATWIYAGFVGLIIALMTSLSTLLYVFFLPMIRWRRVRTSRLSAQKAAKTTDPKREDLPPLPTFTPPPVPAHGPSIDSSIDLPPLPPLSPQAASHAQIPPKMSTIELGGWSTLTQGD